MIRGFTVRVRVTNRKALLARIAGQQGETALRAGATKTAHAAQAARMARTCGSSINNAAIRADVGSAPTFRSAARVMGLSCGARIAPGRDAARIC